MILRKPPRWRAVAALLVPAVLAACSSPERVQPPETIQPPYTGAEFRRWSAVVSDIDETIRLYRDILGFELGSLTVDPKDSYVYTIFNIDRSITTRHATFDAGDKKRVLSVVEVPGIDLPRPPQSPRTSVALINANGRFDEIVRLLDANGYEVFESHPLGENGIEVGFLDRDGHLYSLYEFR